MSYVIKIEWLGWQEVKQESQHEGRYVSRYNPDAHDGLGQVWTVADPRDAKQFATPQEAYLFLKQTSSVKPKREDGRPNRPITAFTVTVFDWEKP